VKSGLQYLKKNKNKKKIKCLQIPNKRWSRTLKKKKGSQNREKPSSSENPIVELS
jgi:hypothetical protein